MQTKLSVLGVSRDADSPGGKSILVAFSRQLTDAELRFFHEVCERTAPLMAILDAPSPPSARRTWP